MSRAKISSSYQQGTILVERMNEHDLLEVVELEESTGLSLWGWEAYHVELRREGSIMLVSRPIIPYENASQRLTGFIAARIEADELHINNVGVKTEFRKKGVGGALLETVLGIAQQSDARRASLEVRAGNSTAQSLYLRFGFFVAGRRHNYYHHPVEDALVMARDFNCEA